MWNKKDSKPKETKVNMGEKVNQTVPQKSSDETRGSLLSQLGNNQQDKVSPELVKVAARFVAAEKSGRLLIETLQPKDNNPVVASAITSFQPEFENPLLLSRNSSQFWRYICANTDSYSQEISLLLDRYESKLSAFMYIHDDSVASTKTAVSVNIAPPPQERNKQNSLKSLAQNQSKSNSNSNTTSTEEAGSISPRCTYILDIIKPTYSNLFREKLHFLRRYVIQRGHEYESVSESTITLFARQKKFHNYPVILKFFKYKYQYLKELSRRSVNCLEPYFVLPVLANCDGDENLFFKQETTDAGLFPYLIVFPAADGNLPAILSRELIFSSSDTEGWSPSDLNHIRYISRQIVRNVEHVHSKGVVHGAIHPASILYFSPTSSLRSTSAITGATVSDPVYLLADLDFSCTLASSRSKPVNPSPTPAIVHDDIVILDARKDISALSVPPEALTLQDERGGKRHVSIKSYPLGDPSGCPIVDSRDKTLLRANPAYDMWGLGVVLYYLFTNGLHLYDVIDYRTKRSNSGASANGAGGHSEGHTDDTQSVDTSTGSSHTTSSQGASQSKLMAIYRWSDKTKEHVLSYIHHVLARDLLSRILEKDPMMRLTTTQILAHPFFSDNNYTGCCDVTRFDSPSSSSAPCTPSHWSSRSILNPEERKLPKPSSLQIGSEPDEEQDRELQQLHSKLVDFERRMMLKEKDSEEKNHMLQQLETTLTSAVGKLTVMEKEKQDLIASHANVKDQSVLIKNLTDALRVMDSSLTEKEKSIETLTAQIESKDQRIRALLSGTRSEGSDLKEEVASVPVPPSILPALTVVKGDDDRINALTRCIEEKDLTITLLTHQLESTNARLADCESKYQEALDQSKKGSEIYQSIQLEYENKIKELQEKLKLAAECVDSSRVENDLKLKDLQEKVRISNETIQNLHHENDKKIKEYIDQIKVLREGSKKALIDSTDKITFLETQLQHSKQHVTTLTKELNDCKEALEGMQKESLGRVQGDKTGDEDQMSALLDTLASKEEIIADYIQQVSDLMDQLNGKDEMLWDKDKWLSDKDEQINELVQQLNEKDEESQQLQERINSQEDEIQRLTDEIFDRQNDIQVRDDVVLDLEDEINEMTERLAEARVNLSENSNQLADLEAILQEKEAKLMALSTELDALKKNHHNTTLPSSEAGSQSNIASDLPSQSSVMTGEKSTQTSRKVTFASEVSGNSNVSESSSPVFSPNEEDDQQTPTLSSSAETQTDSMSISTSMVGIQTESPFELTIRSLSNEHVDKEVQVEGNICTVISTETQTDIEEDNSAPSHRETNSIEVQTDMFPSSDSSSTVEGATGQSGLEEECLRLRSLVAEKDGLITSLSKEVQELQDSTLSVKTSLAEGGDSVSSDDVNNALKIELSQRNEELAVVKAQLTEKEKKSNEKNIVIADKNKLLTERLKLLMEKDALLFSQENSINELRQQVQDLQRKLDDMESTIANLPYRGSSDSTGTSSDERVGKKDDDGEGKHVLDQSPSSQKEADEIHLNEGKTESTVTHSSSTALETDLSYDSPCRRGAKMSGESPSELVQSTPPKSDSVSSPSSSTPQLAIKYKDEPHEAIKLLQEKLEEARYDLIEKKREFQTLVNELGVCSKVLAAKEKQLAAQSSELAMKDAQINYKTLQNIESQKVIMDKDEHIKNMSEELVAKERIILQKNLLLARNEALLEEKDRIISSINGKLADFSDMHKSHLGTDSLHTSSPSSPSSPQTPEGHQSAVGKQLASPDKVALLHEKELELAEKERQLVTISQQLTQEMAEKNSLDEKLSHIEAVLTTKEAQLLEKDREMSEWNHAFNDREKTLLNIMEELAIQAQASAEKDRIIEEMEIRLEHQQEQLQRHDEIIIEKENQLLVKTQQIEYRDKIILQKDDQISSLVDQLLVWEKHLEQITRGERGADQDLPPELTSSILNVKNLEKQMHKGLTGLDESNSGKPNESGQNRSPPILACFQISDGEAQRANILQVDSQFADFGARLAEKDKQLANALEKLLKRNMQLSGLNGSLFDSTGGGGTGVNYTPDYSKKRSESGAGDIASDEKASVESGLGGSGIGIGAAGVSGGQSLSLSEKVMRLENELAAVIERLIEKDERISLLSDMLAKEGRRVVGGRGRGRVVLRSGGRGRPPDRSSATIFNPTATPPPVLRRDDTTATAGSALACVSQQDSGDSILQNRAHSKEEKMFELERSLIEKENQIREAGSLRMALERENKRLQSELQLFWREHFKRKNNQQNNPELSNPEIEDRSGGTETE